MKKTHTESPFVFSAFTVRAADDPITKQHLLDWYFLFSYTVSKKIENNYWFSLCALQSLLTSGYKIYAVGELSTTQDLPQQCFRFTVEFWLSNLFYYLQCTIIRFGSRFNNFLCKVNFIFKNRGNRAVQLCFQVLSDFF